MSITHQYDAFISYRQKGIDKKIANKLHRALETYRVPKSLVKQGTPRKTHKVFKDVDELSASHDLNASIRSALESSKYLIVICSPRTPESEWIKKEISIFCELGRADKILPILIEGTKEDSFPSELLQYSEPLAADIRDKFFKPSASLLKDAKLRILAPILGCQYDELKQREQNRFIQKLTVIAAVALLLTALFAGLSLQLLKSNNTLDETNKRLSQSIFETSAIYAQFFLIVHDDYETWAKASEKVFSIFEEKNVERAIKVNKFFSKDIAFSEYKPKDNIEVYGFFENPQYFLKKIFFTKDKLTTVIIEYRYVSLFLLDNLSFPAHLFLFLANPPIELPDIYQRQQASQKNDSVRYGNLLKAIFLESEARHADALTYIHKAAEAGVFHSLQSISSGFSLASINLGLHFIEEADEKKLDKEKQRFMNDAERLNLIKHLNSYYLLTLAYSQLNSNKSLDLINDTSKFILKELEPDYGEIRYEEIADYIKNNLSGPDAKPQLTALTSKLDQPLKLPPGLQALKEKYENEVQKTNQELQKRKAEIGQKVEQLLRQKMPDLYAKVAKNIDKRNSQHMSNDNISSPKANDFDKLTQVDRNVNLIDEEIDSLGKKERTILRNILRVPSHIPDTGKEIRIYISQQIRPYRVHTLNYDQFIEHPIVFEQLQKLNSKNPKDPNILFALSRYWLLQNEREKSDEFYKKALSIAPYISEYQSALSEKKVR